jgi:hypothetical protein
MTKRRHTNLFEVLVCQIRQNGEADVIFGKPLSILPKAELLKPLRNLLHLGRHWMSLWRGDNLEREHTRGRADRPVAFVLCVWLVVHTPAALVRPDSRSGPAAGRNSL